MRICDTGENYKTIENDATAKDNNNCFVEPFLSVDFNSDPYKMLDQKKMNLKGITVAYGCKHYKKKKRKETLCLSSSNP